MWSSFENGDSLGTKGCEQGEIIRDEEHSLGARITLEKGGNIAPFSVTCGIYGWMVHTRFFATEQDAHSEYEKMRAALAEIIAPLGNPGYDNQQATIEQIHEFVRAHP